MAQVARRLRGFWRNRRGAVATEFALTLPILMTMIVTGAEFTRYALLNQKLDRVSTTIADLVAQEDAISESEMTGIFQAVAPLISPFSWGSDGVMIISSVSLVGGVAKVTWQRTFGAMPGNSRIGQQGGNATLPAGLVVRAGETIIVGEAGYTFSPFFVQNMLNDVSLATDLYHRAFYRPRTGTLTAINPG